MRSLMLWTIARGVLPVTALFAVYLLLRGHDAPGGGFVAGLVTAAGIVLQALAFGADETRRALTPTVRLLIPVGLLLAAGTGAGALAFGEPFLAHDHFEIPLVGGQIGTTLLFDVGVYLVVVGVASTFLSELARGPR